MLTMLKLLLILAMAFYSFKVHGEILIIKKGIQPVKEKKEKKSKTKKASEQEPEKEHECEKEIKLCEANNAKP